ncbi:MAG: ABC transporter ATP-binding protein [Polyangiaceae bacterium]
MTSLEQTPALRAINLRIRRGKQTPLDGVSLDLRRGELVFVVGPNGAGKSTMIRTLAGLISTYEGHVLVQGSDLTQFDRRSIARRISWVEQTPEVAVGFTVREVVAMGRAPFQDALMQLCEDDLQKVDRALSSCDLSHHTTSNRRSFQVVSNAESASLAPYQDTAILLMDEPGAHLDASHALALAKLVRHEADIHRRACLVISHDLNLAHQFADRVVVMSSGKIIADAPAAEALDDRILETVFSSSLVAVNIPNAGRYIVPPPR